MKRKSNGGRRLWILVRRNVVTGEVSEYNIAYTSQVTAKRWASYLNAHRRLHRFRVEELVEQEPPG